jgi:hypothetical protein
MENCGERRDWGWSGKPINFLRWTNVDAQTVDFNFIETQNVVKLIVWDEDFSNLEGSEFAPHFPRSLFN